MIVQKLTIFFISGPLDLIETDFNFFDFKTELANSKDILSAECIPQQVWRLHAELCAHALAQRASDVTALSSSDRHVTHERSQALARHLTSLCEQAREVDAEHERELLPVLKERIGRATQALGECAGVNEAMRLWWEQPAQDVTPWRKVDGRSFQQWKDKFVVLMTRLRQQELVRK